MKKRTLLALLILCVITLSLSACKSKETETSEPSDSTEVTYEELPEVPDEPAMESPIETTSEESELKPWAEEHNIVLYPEDVEAPYYAYPQLDGSDTDEISVTQFNATYHIPSFTVSDADEEGNVTYTIHYRITFPYYAEVPAHITNFTPRYTAETYYVMDYYTGTVFASSDLTNENEHSYDLPSVFEWNGTTYTVSVAERGEENILYQNIEYIDDTCWKFDGEYEWNGFISIVAPKDYNGLILYLDQNGVTEKISLSAEATTTHLFGETEDEMIESGYFVRVNDLLSE